MLPITPGELIIIVLLHIFYPIIGLVKIKDFSKLVHSVL